MSNAVSPLRFSNCAGPRARTGRDLASRLHFSHLTKAMSRLSSIGRQRYVSSSALAAVLKDVQQHGMPSATSRSSIKRSREKELSEMTNQFGSILRYTDFEPENEEDNQIRLPFIHPFVFLQHCMSQCDAFQRYWNEYLTGVGESPMDPLQILIYSDEISPGNALRHDPTRKVQIIYWTIKQGGGLGVDQLWWTLGIVRSNVVSQLKGGMSCYVKRALEHFVKPLDMRKGVQLELGGGGVCVTIRFFEFSMYVADEAALKETYGFKGASGLLICPLCANVVAYSSDLHSHNPNLEPSTSTEPSKWERCGNDVIFAKLRKLHRSFGNVTRAEFEFQEKSVGWVYNPEGLLGNGLANPLGIQPASMIQYDYMHVLLVNGCWNIETGSLVAALKTNAQIGQEVLHRFLNDLTWPHTLDSHASSGKNIFKKKHEGRISCSASEALSCYTCLRAWLIINIKDLTHIRKEVDSYMALAGVLDVLIGLRKDKQHPRDLSRAIGIYVNLHKKAYGSTLWVPKFHYLQHLPEMIEQQKCIVGCFVHERKHRIAKRYAENLRNVNDAFEESVIKDVLYINVHDLSDKTIDQLHIGLIQPTPASPTLSKILRDLYRVRGDVFQARQAHYQMGCLAAVDDFVLLEAANDQIVGQVHFFAALGSVNLVCISIWKSKGQNQFEKCKEDGLFDLETIQDCIIYKPLTQTRIFAVPNSLWSPSAMKV